MQVSFKAQLLNTPTIYKKNNDKFNQKQSVKFLEVDINSEEDYEAIREVGFSWQEGSSLAGDMLDMLAAQKYCTSANFCPSYRYFALTNQNDNRLTGDSILGVASIRPDSEDTLTLQHLQVNPEQIYGSKTREYKHIGKAILTSIIDLFPKKNIKLYPFTYDAEKFYEKFDFKKLPNSFYMMRKAKL